MKIYSDFFLQTLFFNFRELLTNKVSSTIVYQNRDAKNRVFSVRGKIGRKFGIGD